MQTKPPSREELAFEWFVGDAKEVMRELASMKDEMATIHSEQQKESAASLAALVALNKDVVIAYRDLSRVSTESVKNIEEAAHAASRDMVKTSAIIRRRIASAAIASAAVGAAAGAAVVLAGFMLFVSP